MYMYRGIQFSLSLFPFLQQVFDHVQKINASTCVPGHGVGLGALVEDHPRPAPLPHVHAGQLNALPPPPPLRAQRITIARVHPGGVRRRATGTGHYHLQFSSYPLQVVPKSPCLAVQLHWCGLVVPVLTKSHPACVSRGPRTPRPAPCCPTAGTMLLVGNGDHQFMVGPGPGGGLQFICVWPTTVHPVAA